VIEAEKASFPIELMCEVLKISRSAWYAWKNRPESIRKQSDRLILEKIRKVYKDSRGTYGSPRITTDLNELGENINRKRVARLMRENGIVGSPEPKWRVTTESNHDMPVAPNLLSRNFTADAPDKVWVGDITYIWTYRGWSYLATVIDLFSRRIVGWALEDNMRSELVEKALKMAIRQRNVEPGLVFHSDRGSQYAGKDYQRLLQDFGILPSMSRKGDCWDNAVAESFFATIKRELINRAIWINQKNLRMAVYEYVEVFYNRKRRHSTNHNLCPAEHERIYFNNAAVAA
jgi:putative transposase